MTNWRLIDKDHPPGGGELALYERGGEYMIRLDGLELMTSEATRSEEAFVGFGLDHLADHPERVLIGGLGLGFTLGEVCRRLPSSLVSVVEISRGVVRWLKGPARNANTNWLADPHVSLVQQDIVDFLQDTDQRYDLILLDIDNGPEALVHPENIRLYDQDGLDLLALRISPEGVIVFWSAIQAPAFEDRLKSVFGCVETRRFSVPENPRVEHFHIIASCPVQPSRDR